MSDPATLAWYERETPEFIASGRIGQARHLEGFLARLKPGSSILELGCGGGRDTAYMIEHGFLVDATDGAAAMVAKANERFNINTRQMTFDQLDAQERYDAVWAHACLLHLPRADLPPVLSAIFDALKPGGLHYANYKLGDADHRNEGPDPLGRWANLPTPEWLEQRYLEAGFILVESLRYRGNGSDGIQRDWSAITVRKA